LSPRKIKIVTLLLLALGLGSALIIFLTAPPEPSDDNTLLNDPRGQRLYHRQMALLGGKANVLAGELQEWFGGLWHGRALAGTVAALTLGATAAFRFFAALPPPLPSEDAAKKSGSEM